MTPEAVPPLGAAAVSWRMSSRRPLRLLSYPVFWSLLALFFASESYLAAILAARPIRWATALGVAAAGWGVWAILAPAVVRLGRAVPLRRGTLAYAAVFHTAASALFGLAHAAGELALRFGFSDPALGGVGYMELLRLRLRLGSHLDLVTYWAILGVSYAIAYYRREQERELRATRLSASLAQTQLELLRMELNPHFLFNALNAISGYVHSDPDAADRMIAKLAELLRFSLEGRGRQEVALRDELRLLQAYVDIERARFRDRLTVDVECEPSLLDAAVPSLLLQPLVENAIRHGIAPRAAPGRVSVRIRREGPFLELQVDDDGVGAAGRAEAPGLGLQNTRSRLHQLYGPAGVLDIHQREAGGTTVRILIPVHPPGISDADPTRSAVLGAPTEVAP